MMKDRWLWIGSVIGLVGVALVLAAVLLPPTPGVTQENFDRIEVGMTRAEVEALFGGEANGEECSGRRVPGLWMNRVDQAQAIIRFNEEDRVVHKTFWPPWPDERTVWQKVLDQLPWPQKSAGPVITR